MEYMVSFSRTRSLKGIRVVEEPKDRASGKLPIGNGIPNDMVFNWSARSVISSGIKPSAV